MEPEIVLAHLRALLEREPNLKEYTPTSREHHTWLGQAHALIARWSSSDAIMLQISSQNLTSIHTREMNIGTIYAIIHRAIADLELRVPAKTQKEFGAGDVYDFFKSLNKVVQSAEKSIFIVDPYLDSSVFEHYLNSRQSEVTIRLLTYNNANSLLPAKDKYNAQYGNVLDVRKSNKLHDRVIFIDGYVCWLIGQSIKDAAKAKPTYLVPSPPDIVPDKLDSYNAIWDSATKL
ncbi:hypothetical protein [Rheinheimera texasensis]|uniref:hypothetical protein n=1 Tax=Rheinheimera texasensis TaxID=306205 RepID=UPI0004E1D38F|nr:hypothetical protein [Rheinheimera texasensis]